ncbi:plant U-box 22 [Actinidia rufa]|uniref:U-box domain-containing protein n=1 Tax=Actinidia rufa TaxID=165716 RepID=A0A7J0FV16_9ERIC|nr:plant U-box 22 [Actinidia rufa]
MEEVNVPPFFSLPNLSRNNERSGDDPNWHNLRPGKHREMDILREEQHLPRNQTRPFRSRSDPKPHPPPSDPIVVLSLTLLMASKGSQHLGLRPKPTFFSLQLSESGLKSLIARNDGIFECLTKIMQRGNYESRAYSVLLVKSLSDVADPIHLTRMKPEIFLGLVQILRDQISSKTSKTTLQLLINACPWGRNRVKAVEAGAVPVLIDVLLESSDKREREMILMVLDQMCDCAEGRSEFLKHKAGLAVVSKKILRVSRVASERAVRILHSICKFSSSASVINEMLDVGVVAKLCLVLQVDCASKTKERAREILKSHARVWRNSSCIPISLISSFPSS